MFPRLTRTIAWLGAALAWSAAVACSAADAGSDGSYAEGIDACDECKTILVECTSTSQDESQFIACRDQWQQCQMGKGLAIGECSNPGDAEACDLCQQRLVACKSESSDAELCETEFSVCKAFLITRGDIQAQCTADVSTTSPEVGCGVCQEDYAACMSDVSQVDGLQLCSDKRVECLTANLVPVEACPAPTSAEACDLCITQHDQCAASAGPSCGEGFTQCAGVLAADIACSLPSGEGGGGAGGGGAGGGGAGGSTGGTCAHDVCEVGEPLDDTCSPCATEVCAQDSWCCTNEWDDLCLDVAAGIASCGCGS